MRFLVERGVRHAFYVIIGLSMVLVTTPSLLGALPASGTVYLWPLIGLLAYFLHLFEDTGKLASFLRSGRGARRSGSSQPAPRLISSTGSPAGAKRV